MIDTLCNVIKSIYSYYIIYCNNSKFIYLFFFCLLALVFCEREYKKKIVYPTLLVLIIIYNPLLYVHIFGRYLENIYWRCMWMVPIIPVIGIGVVGIVFKLKRKIIKIGFLLLSIWVIMDLGTNIYYDKHQFIEATNAYKLPQSSVDVVNQVLEITDNPTAVVTDDLFCYTRQYSSEFKQLYGRDVDGYIYPWWKIEDSIIRQVIDDRRGKDSYRKMMYLKKAGCNIIVCDEMNDDKFLEGSIYEKKKSLCGKGIYFNNMIKEKKGRYEIYQRGFNDLGYRMGYVIEDNKKTKLAIIDGGGPDWDMWMVSDYIEKHNQHVDDWVLTAIEPGHVGVFLDFYRQNSITIDHIYVPQYYIDDKQTVDMEFYNLFYETIKEDKRVIYYEKGTKGKILDLNYEVVSSDKKASCFFVHGDEDSMLFCSDLNESMVGDITEFVEENKVDYMQIAIHNNKSLPINVIDIVNAKIVLLDCAPQSLYTMTEDNITNYWRIRGTNTVDIYDYSTLPNRLLFD